MTAANLMNMILRPSGSGSGHSSIENVLVFTILLLLGAILIPFIYRVYKADHSAAFLFLIIVYVIPIFFYAILVAAEGYFSKYAGGWAGALGAILCSFLLSGLMYGIFAGIRSLAVKVLL
jgi:hypothetical protein